MDKKGADFTENINTCQLWVVNENKESLKARVHLDMWCLPGSNYL